MVRLRCGARFSRALLIILNIIFLLFGLTLLGFGIFIEVNGNFSAIIEAYNITESLGNGTMQWIGAAMIIVGFLTVLLAAFGCLGAVRKKPSFLYIYAFIFTLIILLEFAAVIVILKYRNELWNSYDSGFSDVFKRAYSRNLTETIKAIENLEQEFKCCGVNNSFDYTNSSYSIPNSCYLNKKPMGLPFSDGCANAITRWAWNELPIFAVFIGIILFIEIFGVVSSLVIGVAISHAA